jgi:GNAT superfamily N-acetyltransferase
MTLRYTFSSHTEEERRASMDLIKESFDNQMGAKYYEEYEWLFLQNPAGIGQVLIAYDGDKPVGQITSIPGKYRFMDTDFVAAIAGEWLCVSPKYRGQGIMSKLIHQIANYGNYPFVIDMPNHDSMRGFLKFNYRPMSMKLLTRPLKVSKCFTHKRTPRAILKPFDGIWKSRKRIVTTESFIEEYSLPKFDYRFDDLFEKMTNRNMIMQIRNSDFLNWRYKDIQSRNYKIIVSTQDGRINGYIIIRLAIAFAIRVGFIMDFFPNNSENGRNLIRHALKYFWENNAAVASSLCFPHLKEYGLLKSERFFICPEWIRPYPYKLCVRPSNKNGNQFDSNMLTDSNRWIFSFGDIQFH